MEPVSTPQTPPLKHSRAGIASVIVPISFIAFSSLLMRFGIIALDIGAVFVVFLGIFGGVPLGFILAIIGLVQKNKKKDFAIIGFILNGVALLFAIWIWVG